MGHRFDPTELLLDPACKALTTNIRSGNGYHSVVRSRGYDRPKCVVVNDRFDWQGTQPPRTSLADSIIYEVHLRGLTAHPNSGVSAPGSYLGLIEKIPYLKDLGVTAIELLPIQQFDPHENLRKNPDTDQELTNYWGYSPMAFFAPQGQYAYSDVLGAQVEEFKTMVREMHRAGLEVILDVVFNHTAEGNQLGPTISYKGIDNSIFYFLGDDLRQYKDFSGCGNSMNTNHPVVRDMIRMCLRYWATHMRVDGFRFDLASVLSRDRTGHLISNPPLLESIAEDPMLRDAKIIAEAWDAAGAYQVGSFPGGRWAEWNGRYRDDVRQFWRGDYGKTGALATRLSGSSDLYQASGRKPYHSINFITSHDGFTLNDLVSFNYKHNIANGEDNRDGENHNYSFNYGVEGPTDLPALEHVRLRQIKNMLATLLLSRGVPMLLGGDEFRRTQGGNNNAYCQDNEISWFDWTLLETHHEVHRFAREIIAFRKRHPIFRRAEFFEGRPLSPGRVVADVNWYAADGSPMDWRTSDRVLMCLIDGLPAPGSPEPPDDEMLLLFNADETDRAFVMPTGDDVENPWRLFFDTGSPAPLDVFPQDDGPPIRPLSRYPLVARSAACFHRASRSRRRL
jgi:glycogen operon protein